MSLRSKLGMSEHTTSAFFGCQVANYRQLKNYASVYVPDRGDVVWLAFTPRLQLPFPREPV